MSNAKTKKCIEIPFEEFRELLIANMPEVKNVELCRDGIFSYTDDNVADDKAICRMLAKHFGFDAVDAFRADLAEIDLSDKTPVWIFYENACGTVHHSGDGWEPIAINQSAAKRKYDIAVVLDECHPDYQKLLKIIRKAHPINYGRGPAPRGSEYNTPDAIYRMFLWKNLYPASDDGRVVYKELLPLVEHVRHAFVERDSDGDIFYDYETDDRYGCDEEFKNALTLVYRCVDCYFFGEYNVWLHSADVMREPDIVQKGLPKR